MLLKVAIKEKGSTMGRDPYLNGPQTEARVTSQLRGARAP